MYTRLAGMLNEDKLWSMAGVLNSRCCLCTELKCYWTQLVFLWCTVLAAAKQKEGHSWNGRIYKAQSWLTILHFKETVCEWGACWWPQPLGTVSELHKHDLSEWLTLVLQWWASQCFPFTSCSLFPNLEGYWFFPGTWSQATGRANHFCGSRTGANCTIATTQKATHTFAKAILGKYKPNPAG